MISIYNFMAGKGLTILIAALILMIGQTVVFQLAVRENRDRKQILGAALHLTAGFLIFVILLDGFDNAHFHEIPRTSVQTDWFVFSLPWLVYLALEILSAIILIYCFRDYRHYKTSNVTYSAIRKSIDLLPVGICISKTDGTVLLANLKMNELCRELTGERLADAHGLWTSLLKNDNGQENRLVIHTLQNEVWLFTKERLIMEGRDYERTSAVNVTAKYRITEELKEKNIYLQQIQRRMKEAQELSGEMFIKQEEANARSALHNELGQVLLMGRHYIEHPESTDRAMVALVTRQMNSFLLGETKTPMTETEDGLQLAVLLSGNIGVSVRIHGDPPKDNRKRSLLAQAIRECSANTVKHAEGDTLNVEILEKPSGLLITITNNGKPPKGPVAESGGLLSLRRSVEDSGGQMVIQSQPVFSLNLTL